MNRSVTLITETTVTTIEAEVVTIIEAEVGTTLEGAHVAVLTTEAGAVTIAIILVSIIVIKIITTTATIMILTTRETTIANTTAHLLTIALGSEIIARTIIQTQDVTITNLLLKIDAILDAPLFPTAEVVVFSDNSPTQFL